MVLAAFEAAVEAESIAVFEAVMLFSFEPGG
jgi:hypothetical protein